MKTTGIDSRDETDILRDKMYAMYDFYKSSDVDLGDLTVWDLFMDVLPESDVKMTALLKADLPILELLAGGQTSSQVARTLGITEGSVVKVADLWNINVPLKTLDINPLFVYNDGMDVEKFCEELLESSLRNYSRKELQGYFDNILTYLGLVEFLREEE